MCNVQSTNNEDDTGLYLPACRHLELPYDWHWHDVERQIADQEGQRAEGGEERLVYAFPRNGVVPETRNWEAIETEAQEDRKSVGNDDCTDDIDGAMEALRREDPSIEHQDGHLDEQSGKCLQDEEGEESLVTPVSACLRSHVRQCGAGERTMI